MALAEPPECGVDPHPEWQPSIHEGSEKDCQCHVGPPISPGFSGHEFSPFDEKGIFVRRPCGRPGVWRGLWQCGGCPDTHVALVCDECRAHHDADATAAGGAKLMWIRVQD